MHQIGNLLFQQPARAAAYLGVSPKTLRLAAEGDDIQAMHPLLEGPWLFSRAVLDEPAARALVDARGALSNTPQDHKSFRKIYSLQRHRQMGVVTQDCTTRNGRIPSSAG